MPVYFIQDCGSHEVKIGFTLGEPMARLRKLRTGNPRHLKLLATIPGGSAEERALHDRFAALRVRGEWFKLDAHLGGFIEALIAMRPPPVNEELEDDEDDEDEDAVFSTQQLLVIKGLIADAIKAATSPALGAGIH